MKKCKQCGCEFKPLTNNQQFCKNECRREYNLKLRRDRYKHPLKRIEYCVYCGKPLNPYGSQKYCNAECRRLHRNQKRNKSGRICNRVVVPETLKKCEYCGKDIPFNKNYASTYSRKKYCSRECCSNSFKEHRDRFSGNQLIIDGFKIIIKHIGNNFMWDAYKGNKLVLKGSNPFGTFIECKKDAMSAF